MVHFVHAALRRKMKAGVNSCTREEAYRHYGIINKERVCSRTHKYTPMCTYKCKDTMQTHKLKPGNLWYIKEPYSPSQSFPVMWGLTRVTSLIVATLQAIMSPCCDPAVLSHLPTNPATFILLVYWHASNGAKCSRTGCVDDFQHGTGSPEPLIWEVIKKVYRC